MVSDPVLRWVLTVAFSATGLYSLVRITVDRAPLLIVAGLLHAMMSAGMVAMCWPWSTAVPEAPQLALFGAGAVWFVGVLALQLTRRVPRAALGDHGPWHQAAHAIMMLAMVWMSVAAGAGALAARDHAHHYSSLPVWATLVGVAITAALIVSGVVFLVELIVCLRGRRTWLGHTGDTAAGNVMSLGMAAMCWPMITG